MGRKQNTCQKRITEEISKVDKLWSFMLKKNKAQEQQKKMTTSKSESSEKKKERNQETNIKDG